MKTKKHTSPVNNSPTFRPTRTPTQLTTEFLNKKRAARKFNGESDFIDAFASASWLISNEKKDFSLPDVLQLTRHADNGDGEAVRVIKGLYQDWVAYLRLNKAITSDTWAYDYEICRWQ